MLLDGGVASGEAVFNTALSGYQEVITDPSYAGQVVAFTYPHIGNYGVTGDDEESRHAFLSGVITRDLSVRHSNWRSQSPLEQLLIDEGVPAITGVDTRRLTRHLRSHGALPCAFGTGDVEELTVLATQASGTDGQDFAQHVTCADPYRVGEGPLRVVALDFGIKRTILRQLALFATIDVRPASSSADEVMSFNPDGIFLSNGPGDPSALPAISATVADLVGKRPLFGICLGHQILATALGGSTYKLPFGHHGSNHPVKNMQTGHVEITAQNHNYAVALEAIAGAEVTHVNLNDGVIEGFRIESAHAQSVQHHPEAGPGPHDSAYLFTNFAQAMADNKEKRR